jgi:hypothetical protein
MSAHRESNEQHAENKDATTLSKEPDTSSGLDWQENNIGEETSICVGVSSVLEPDTSSGLDRQGYNIDDETNICVGVSCVPEPDTSSGQGLWESSIDEETKLCVDVRSVFSYPTMATMKSFVPRACSNLYQFPLIFRMRAINPAFLPLTTSTYQNMKQ